jgi:hypothetical protein
VRRLQLNAAGIGDSGQAAIERWATISNQLRRRRSLSRAGVQHQARVRPLAWSPAPARNRMRTRALIRKRALIADDRLRELTLLFGFRRPTRVRRPLPSHAADLRAGIPALANPFVRFGYWRRPSWRGASALMRSRLHRILPPLELGHGGTRRAQVDFVEARVRGRMREADFASLTNLTNSLAVNCTM